MIRLPLLTGFFPFPLDAGNLPCYFPPPPNTGRGASDHENSRYPRRFVARLRYRRAEGRIVWFYQIYRLAQTLRAALTDAADRAGGATALPVYEGQREATLSS